MTQLQPARPASNKASEDAQNVRKGWLGNLPRWAIARVAIQIVAVIAALILSKLLTMPFIPSAPSPLHSPLLIASNLGSASLLVCVYAVSVWLIERRGPKEVDPRRGFGPLLTGTALGAGLMTVIVLILWSCGLATFSPGTGVHGLAGILAASLAVAILEEIILRAIVFRVLEEATGTTFAVIFSSVLFGLLHGVNPGATPLSSVAVALEGGVMLALVFALTRSLWFSIGVHMSWNFVQGAIFGAKVSGFSPSHSLLKTVLNGPDFLTGGDFGPEASIISMAACSVVSIVLGALLIHRNGWTSRRSRLWLA